MHSPVIALLEPSTPDVKVAIDSLMAPYYLELETEPHEWCPLSCHTTQSVLRVRKFSSVEELCRALPKEFRLGADGKLFEYGVQDGELCTYNHKGRWDYWQGGYWKFPETVSVNPEEFSRHACYVSSLPEDFRTTAVVTPDGRWHDLADFGWFMSESDEMKAKAQKQWDVHFAKLIEKYNHCIAIELDVHS